MLVQFHEAAVEPLWSGLNLGVDKREFIAVLGPNGVGKSTLLGTILGTRQLTGGRVDVNSRVGFIPQQRMFPQDLPMRARDLVSLSLAHGAIAKRRPSRARVDELLAEVGATGIAERRVGQLSGGQQQLIRQAQALANDPQLILADEPLLSLDPARQQATAAVQITSSPVRAVLWSTLFAEVAAVGGLILSLAPGLPVSVFVTTISFVIYLVCRLVGWLRNRRAVRDDIAAARVTKAHFEGRSDSEKHHTSTHDETCAHPD